MHASAMRFIGLLLISLLPVVAAEPPRTPGTTLAGVLAASTPSDWHTLDPENTLYLELATGRVVIDLSPVFAPRHVANVKALVRERYFDGLAIVRVQDNYVAQWADPEAENPALARKVHNAQKILAAEFDLPFNSRIRFTPLPERDV